jgi:hypothetical protein
MSRMLRGVLVMVLVAAVAVPWLSGGGRSGVAVAAQGEPKRPEEPRVPADVPGPREAQGTRGRSFVSTSGSDANGCGPVAPCRTFGRALAETVAGGEVVALDSGGYGAFAVTFSVSVIGAPGAHVAITTSGSATAVTVNPDDDGVVTLRNLYLNGPGDTGTGVHVASGRAVHLEDVTASGFFSGAYLHSSTAGAEYFVSDSLFRDNIVGLWQLSGTATVDATRSLNNTWGFVTYFTGSTLNLRDSVASGNGSEGVQVSIGSARAVIQDSLLTSNGAGIYSSNSTNQVVVSGSTIAHNGAGLSGPGVRISHGNNAVSANDTNGTFTSTVGMQ